MRNLNTQRHISQLQLFKVIAGMSLVIFIMTTAGLTLYLSIKAPWLGIDFAALNQDVHDTALHVQAVHPLSPLNGRLQSGQRVSLLSGKTKELPMQPLLFYDFNHFMSPEKLSHFFDAKKDVYHLFNWPDVRFKQDDRVINFTSNKNRPLSSLPWQYWLIFLIGLCSLLLACRSCLRQSTALKIVFSFVIGFGVYIAMLSKLLLYRDIGLGEYYFPVLVISETVAANSVLIAVIALLALYPVALLSKRSMSILFIAALLFIVNDYTHWFAIPFHSFYLLLVVLLSLLIYRFLMIGKWKVQIIFSLLSILIFCLVNSALILGLSIHPALSLAFSGLLASCLYYMLRANLLKKLQTSTGDGHSRGKAQIIHDIHDTVGASLITLMNQMNTPEDANRVQTVIQTLRDTIRLSSSDSEYLLEDILADSHAEARQRTELANCSLEWSYHNKQASPYPPKKTKIKLNQSISLTNIIREAISNALKHGEPHLIQCNISLINKKLHILIRNDGKVNNPEKWVLGFGLRNMKARIEHLGGTFSVGAIPKQGVPKKVGLIAVFPLATD